MYLRIRQVLWGTGTVNMASGGRGEVGQGYITGVATCIIIIVLASRWSIRQTVLECQI